MALLFFALDLRTLSPPLLAQVKQCLLELANLYALSAPTSNLKRRNLDSSLEDLIGLCYLQRSAASSSDELKIVYSPRGRSFNLRDFHYAVNHLPSDSYSPPFEDSGSFVLNMDISCILSDEVLTSAGGKETEKKIILISSCLVGNLDSNAKKTLLDAADRCISVEFVFLEQKSSQLSDISENINKFRGQICDLENCSFNAYLSDGQVFNGLAKRWLRELKEITEELLQAHFLFRRSIAGSVNRISCRLCDSINQIMDGFRPCETHRCHDSRRDDGDGHVFKECLMYNVKKHDVEPDNADNISMTVGENGLLAEASWRCWKNLCQVPYVVDLNVIERTSLASLSEAISVQPSLVKKVAASPREVVVVPSQRDIADVTQRTCASDQADEDDKGISRLTQEWEQLIVGGIPSLDSVLSEPNLKKATTSPPASHRPLDTKTSIILERLGNPKLIKTKANTHNALSGLTTNGNERIANHVFIDIDAADQGLTAPRNLMKPTFQRLKRKQR